MIYSKRVLYFRPFALLIILLGIHLINYSILYVYVKYLVYLLITIFNFFIKKCGKFLMKYILNKNLNKLDIDNMRNVLFIIILAIIVFVILYFKPEITKAFINFSSNYKYLKFMIHFIIKYHYTILIAVTVVSIISTILGFPVLHLVTSTICPFMSKSEMIRLANTLNIFMEIFLPWTIIFICIIICVVYYTFSKYINIIYFIIPLLITTSVLFYFPLAMLFSSLFMTLLIIFILYSPFLQQWVAKCLSVGTILNFLHHIGCLMFLYRLFNIIFGSDKSKFLLLVLSSHGLSLLYTIFARYYIFITFALLIPLSWNLQVMLFILIFICLVALLFRFLANLSLIVSLISMNQEISLWKNFLLTEVLEPDMPPSTSSGSSNTNPSIPDNTFTSTPVSTSSNEFKNQSYMTIAKQLKYAIYFKNINGWKFAQFGLGVCVLGVTCYAAYETHLTVVESREANRLSRENNVMLEEGNRKAEEANRLKRFEMAKADPIVAPFIFRGHPQEYADFEAFQKQEAWNHFDKEAAAWSKSPWYSRGRAPTPPIDPRPLNEKQG